MSRERQQRRPVIHDLTPVKYIPLKTPKPLQPPTAPMLLNERVNVAVRLCPQQTDEAHMVHAQGGAIKINADSQCFTKSHYSHVFNTDADQETVFHKVGKPALKQFLEGYNCSMIAYGQSKSGRSYTMFGGPSVKLTSLKVFQANQ